MNSFSKPIRPLSIPEEAFAISNEGFPLSVVCSLSLENGPSEEVLRKSISTLQTRHPLLKVGIKKKNGKFWFHQLQPVPPLELIIKPRENEETWKLHCEGLLNTKFDKNGPLMKLAYIYSPDQEKSEALVCFHHSIMDGTAARLILHEILSLCAGEKLPVLNRSLPHPQLPKSLTGWSLIKRLLPFMRRQMADEWNYRKNGLNPPITSSPHNKIISLRLSENLSRNLILKAGRKGISLNNLLSAAITQAVLKIKYPERNAPLARVINFAEIRDELSPPLKENDLGCGASMFRFSIEMKKGNSLEEVSKFFKKAMFKAKRRDEIMLMAKLSKSLIKMAFRLKKIRLGTTALSYIGKLNLNREYGSIRLKNLSAFITNNPYGPEFSGFGKILFGRIGLDFTYLTDEMESETAQFVIDEIQTSLEKFVEIE